MFRDSNVWRVMASAVLAGGIASGFIVHAAVAPADLAAGELNAAVVSGGGPAKGGATTTATTPASAAALDAAVERGIKAKEFPGAVLIIGRGNDVLYEKAYGRHTYQPNSKPMTMDTLFDMASVSKVVGTASAAMALVEDGKLDLDSPVMNYINGFGAEGKEDVRVRDLMTHVSGLKSYESVDKAKARETEGVSSADALIMQIASLKLSNAPRTTTTYSCLNMLTQARVNENLLGCRQDDYLSTRVWGRLGMKDTTYRPTAEQQQRTAPSVQTKDGKGLVGRVHDPLASYHSPELHCPGNAGVFSTAPDLAKFMQMTVGLGRLGSEQIFKPETVLAMTKIQTPKELSNVRGLGWDIYPRPPYCTSLNCVDGKRVIAHTGYTGTMIWGDMNTGAWMVFLTNRTYPDDSKQSGRGVTQARKDIIETILRDQPEYGEYFAQVDAEEKAEEAKKESASVGK